jgi:hypothetical protein
VRETRRRAGRWARPFLLVAWAAAARAQNPTTATVLQTQVALSAIVGRVCIDTNGDGLCESDEAGVPGVWVLLDDGKRAKTDAQGRYHFPALPSRPLYPSATAAGPLSAVEGIGRQRVRIDTRSLGPLLKASEPGITVELPPAAIARADFPLVRATPMLALEPPRAGSTERAALTANGVAYLLTGHVAPKSTVFVAGKAVAPASDGDWASEVELKPGSGQVPIAVSSPEGLIVFYEQRVDVVDRHGGGFLVVPREPERLGEAELPPFDGAVPAGQFTIRARIPAGASLAWGQARIESKDANRELDREVAIPWGTAEVPVEFSAAGREAHRFKWHMVGESQGALVGYGALEGGWSPQDKRLSLVGRGDVSYRQSFGDTELVAGLHLDNDVAASLLSGSGAERLAGVVHGVDGVIEQSPSPILSQPEFGDDAIAMDDNPSQGALYLRLHNPEYGDVRVGSFHTSLGDVEVGAYQRSLFGASAAGQLALGSVQLGAHAFAAPGVAAGVMGAMVPAHDEMEATGGSLYYLRHGSVVEGSEKIELEFRDALTGAVLERRRLVRYADYSVEIIQGRILLARPPGMLATPGLSSTLPATTGSIPVLVVDYEWQNPNANPHDAVGGNLRGAFGDVGSLTLRGAAQDDEYRLLGGSARLSLGPVNVLADAARSWGTLLDPAQSGGFGYSNDGGLSYATTAAANPITTAGNAASVRANVGEGDNAGSVYWRYRDADFSDDRFSGPTLDRELGGDFHLRLGNFRFFASGLDATMPDRRDFMSPYSIEVQQLGGGIGFDYERWHLTAEGRYFAADMVQDPGAPNEVPEFGMHYGVGLRLDYDVTQQLTLGASYFQNLEASGALPGATNETFGAVEGTWHGPVPLSLRVGYGPFVGVQAQASGQLTDGDTTRYGAYTADLYGPGTRMVTGGQQRLDQTTSTFAEQAVVRDIDALRATSAVGLAVAPVENLKFIARYERGERLAMSDESGATPEIRDVGSATVEYGRGGLRAQASAEVRRDRCDLGGSLSTYCESGNTPSGPVDRWQTLATAAASYEIVPGLRFSAHGIYALTRERAELEALSLEGYAALAWILGSWTMLAAYTVASEGGPGDLISTTPFLEHIVSLQIAWIGWRHFHLGGGVYAGFLTMSGQETTTIAASLRPALVLFDHLELAIEAGQRAGAPTGDNAGPHAGRAEIGLRTGPGLIAVGYNAFGYQGNGVDARTGLLKGPQDRVYVRGELAY